MFAFIAQNISTIIVAAALILIVALIVKHLIKNKRQGKSSCCSGCAHCALCDKCHGAK